MMGDMLGGAFTEGLLTPERMIHPWNVKNITNEIFDIFFPPIPKKDAVRFRSMILCGKMESGKTSYFNAIAVKSFAYYGKENVNIIASNSLALGIQLFNYKPVQLILVDDAIRSQDCRDSGKSAQKDLVKDYFEIRHKYEDASKTLKGIVCLIFSTQRFKGIDITMQDADITIFKSFSNLKKENDFISDNLDSYSIKALQDINDRILKCDDDAKSDSIAIIPAARKQGLVRLPYVEPFLKMKKEGDFYERNSSFMVTRESILEQLSKENDWKREANIFYKYAFDHLSQDELAKEYKTNQKQISRAVNAIRGELSNRGGKQYENYIADKFKTDGLDVQHLGGNGQPDIITQNMERGDRRVWSLKCLDYDHKVTLDTDELRPEFVYGQANKVPVTLLVFNLATRRTKRIDFEPDNPPISITLDPKEA